MTKVLEIKQLSVAFQTAKSTLTAIDAIDFELIKGKTTALLGESGCGKSLTCLALMRLLPHYTVYGNQSHIQFENQDLLDIPERVMRLLRGRKIAMVFQEPMSALNPVLTIGHQLAESIQTIKHLDSQALHSRMLQLLDEVELSSPELRLKQYPHQLSGGQKQRVLIAMALAGQPDILIADEPTTALDVTIQAQILALLHKLQQTYEMSILLITHDLTVVKAVADYVYVMYDGQIVESSPAASLFKKPLHPYTQQLLASMPTATKRGQALHAIPGQVPALNAIPSGCRFHPRCAHAFSLCSEQEPQLLGLEKQREVRCHLYPDHKALPPLVVEEIQLTTRKPDEEVLFLVDDLSVYFPITEAGLSFKKTLFPAVEGLSFSLKKGKTLALVGESGSGKSTVGKALIGLLPVSRGKIYYQGQLLSALGRKGLRDFRRKVQIIFQDPYASLNPRMMIGDILAEGMLAQGFSTHKIAESQRRLLDQVQLPQSVLSRYPHQFSGGQRQRICIARALAVEPEVLICDEPTSALDVSVQAQILNLLQSIQRERGLSYLFITHNMAVVSYLADDVLVMEEGKGVEWGSCESVLSNPIHPYTKHLLASVLSL